jgi:nucleoside-diphosphate-sugar epimerase
VSTHFLVTGGAGFLGINLVRHLLERGDRVTSLDRTPFDYPERPRIREVRGDIRDPVAVRDAMTGVDVVVHAAAALPLYSPEEIRTTDVEGTRTVLETARAAGVPRVVHVSSTAVYGIPDHHPLVEDDRLHGVGPYGEAKVAAEEVCVEYRSRGLCVPIVRPKSFIGPERLGVFALLYDWAADGRSFPILGRGDNRYQLLDVEDLCTAIVLCATLPRERADSVFNIGAREFTTMREPLPAAPAIWTLRLLERLKLSPLYRWVYETAATDSFVSIQRAERVLGWSPRYSNRDALIRNFEWYLARRDSFRGESGVTHRVPWKQGILGVAKRLF